LCRAIVYATLLLALAAIPRVFLLGNHSLWLDESYSLGVSASEVSQILANTDSAHPPLYYLLLHFWLALGRSEVLLRLPSAILGALSVPLAYVLVRVWFPERTALLVAFLLALSPLHVWYSQEARMYSLVTLLGLGSMLCLSLVLERGGPIWWVAYLFSSLAGLYTHYGMLALLLGENVWVVSRWATRRGKPGFVGIWFASQAALALGFLPWIPVFISNISGQAGFDSFILATLGSLWDADDGVLLGGGLAFLLALAVGTSVLWLKRPARTAEQRVAWLGTAALVAYPLLTISSAVPLGISVKRQLVILLPYFLLLAAAGLEKLRRGRNLVTLSMVFLACVSLAASYVQRETEDWRGPARIVQGEGQANDAILFYAGYTQSSFNFYYRGALAEVPVSFGDMDSQLGDVQHRYRRTWVILSHDTYDDPDGEFRMWVARRWTLLRDWSFVGVEVRLYDTGNGES